jgi:hypothetical protein
MKVKDFFKGDLDGDIDTAGIDAGTLQQMILFHELGHCLLGSSENKADTFAALMMLRHGKNDKILPLMATWREFDEWTNPDFAGDYFISNTLWSVLGIEGQLRASKKFMEMDVKDIASLANEVADKYGMSKEEIDHRRRFRVAMNKVLDMKAHYIEVDGGVQQVSAHEWMMELGGEFPEIARFGTLMENLKFGAVALEPFKSDVNAFKTGMTEIKVGGDRTARTFMAQYDAKHGVKKTNSFDDFGPRIGFRPMPKDDALKEIIAVDRKVEKIGFSFDNDVWVVRDKDTGAVLRAGSSSLGKQWEGNGYIPAAEPRIENLIAKR